MPYNLELSRHRAGFCQIVFESSRTASPLHHVGSVTVVAFEQNRAEPGIASAKVTLQGHGRKFDTFISSLEATHA